MTIKRAPPSRDVGGAPRGRRPCLRALPGERPTIGGNPPSRLAYSLAWNAGMTANRLRMLGYPRRASGLCRWCDH